MVKYEKRAQILEQIFGNTFYNKNNKEVLVYCPNKCKSNMRKLSINIERNAGHCWICGDMRGSIFFFLKKFANRSQRDRYIKTLDIKALNKIQDEVKEVEYPYSFKSLLENVGHSGRPAYREIKRIGITDEQIRKYRIGYCDDGFYKNRIIFPSFDEDGRMNYFIGRDYSGNSFKKYLDCAGVRKTNVVFNELYLDWNKPVIITENIKTSYIHSSIYNLVPLMGSERLPKRLIYDLIVNDVRDVYIALDPDMEKKSKEFIMNLDSYGINAKHIPTKDQPDNVSTEEFLEWIERATEISKMDVLKERIMEL